MILAKTSDDMTNTTNAEPEDDSLTNLQWLQKMTINIVDVTSNGGVAINTGYPLPYSPASSTTSDDCSKYTTTDEASRQRVGHRTLAHVGEFSFCDDAGYKENPHLKPPYSYAMLICMAMKAAESAKVTLSSIYHWITEHFVYYKYADPSWQNSIRHNLSLNKCFAKVPRKKGDPGKGGYWMLVPEYADRLLESCQRKRRAANDYRDSLIHVKRTRSESDAMASIPLQVSLPYRRASVASSSFGSRPDVKACRMDHCYNKLVLTPVKQKQPKEQPQKDVDDDVMLFPSALKNDLCWNQSDMFNESMRSVTQDLLDARTLNFINDFTSNNNTSSVLSLSGGSRFADYELSSPFCVSPPQSADDNDEPVEFTDQLDLTVKGFSVPLHALSETSKHASAQADDTMWQNDTSQFDVNILIQNTLSQRNVRF